MLFIFAVIPPPYHRYHRYITGAILCTNGVGNFVASYKCAITGLHADAAS